MQDGLHGFEELGLHCSLLPKRKYLSEVWGYLVQGSKCRCSQHKCWHKDSLSLTQGIQVFLSSLKYSSEKDELKLKGSGFMCLSGFMKAPTGDTDKINLVCYFERCCINTVKDSSCYSGLSLKMDKRDRRKEEKQKCRGKTIGSSLPRLFIDSCDSQHYQQLVLPTGAAVAPILQVFINRKLGNQIILQMLFCLFQSTFGMVHICGRRCCEGGSTVLQPQLYLCSCLVCSFSWTFYSVKRWILTKHTSFIINHYYFIGIVAKAFKGISMEEH